MRFLIKIAAVALAVWVTTMIVPGIQVTGGLKNYLIIALVLAVINATLGTLLKVLTLPLAFLSLGISLLVVNTAMLLITDRINENMTITGFSCLVMAYLPTYAEIGITASIIVTLCRIMQGLSSLGEVVSAEIYAVETMKSPKRDVFASFLWGLSGLGSLAALAVASSVTLTSGDNWRQVFNIAMMVAFFGLIARTKLHETPEFVDMKQRYNKALDNGNKKEVEKIKNTIKENDT
jgi:uncharacterized membrane protein YvlD (DUF360 family)